MKSYRVEIKLSDEQVKKIENTSSICRFIYNEMLATNELLYQMNKLIGSNNKFMNAYDFSKYVNNTLAKYPSMRWIKKADTKAVKQAMLNCEKSFKKFFNKQGGYPKYKKKKNFYGVYLPKNSPTSFKVERHKVKIPHLSWIRLKEKGYIPKNANITSCTITKITDRYFASFLTKEPLIQTNENNNDGIGIDLGVKDLAICSNGMKFKNINKTSKIKKLEKRLKRKQKSLSRKFEKNKKGGATKQNIKKNILSVQKIYFKLSNIRTEYIKSIVNTLVRTKPKYITIEDLNVKGMMKNKHLSKAIANQKWYYFKIFLIQQCNKKNIEVRVVSRFYASSKICNSCGNIKKDLKLKDRKYICECGYTNDRDMNASLNLKDCEKYKIA